MKDEIRSDRPVGSADKKKRISKAPVLYPSEHLAFADTGLKKKFCLSLLLSLLVSLALPFVLVLVQCGIQGDPIADHFARFYRFFVLGGLIFAMLVVLEVYVYIRSPQLFKKKQLGVVLTSVVLTYLFAVVFGSLISPYIVPLVLSGLLMGMLLERRLALFSNILVDIAFFLYYVTVMPDLELIYIVSAVLVQGITASLMIITMKRYYTRGTFIFSALIIGVLVSAPLSVLAGLLSGDFFWADVLVNALWSFLSSLLGVALFMVLLPIIERIFRLYSNFRLEELVSTDAKLLKRLYSEAVGTYDHSAAVANLAEACAIRIGEEHVLVKAAAYYHDVGKLKDPLCFSENQHGYNPHDDYIPEVSIQKITEHASYGASLIREYRLPDILADVCLEHHGTTPVQYFYNKVRNITDDVLEKEEFCYPGPKPQTRVSAIIMIADTVESATRSMKDEDMDESQLREFIHKLINGKVQAGQFSECPITLKDLQDIEDTLVNRIPSINHKRIKYDNLRRK